MQLWRKHNCKPKYWWRFGFWSWKA